MAARTVGLARLIMMWTLTLTAAAIDLTWMDAPEFLVGATFVGLGWAASDTMAHSVKGIPLAGMGRGAGARRSVGTGTSELAAGSRPRLAAESRKAPYVRRGSEYPGMRRPCRR